MARIETGGHRARYTMDLDGWTRYECTADTARRAMQRERDRAIAERNAARTRVDGVLDAVAELVKDGTIPPYAASVLRSLSKHGI